MNNYTLEQTVTSIADDLTALADRITCELKPPTEEHALEHPPIEGEIGREHRTLETALSREEVENRAQELADTIVKCAAVEQMKAAFGEAIKSVTKMLEANRSANAGLVRRKKRNEYVECAFVLAGSKVNVVRLDTGEVVETRAPKDKERQMKLVGNA